MGRRAPPPARPAARPGPWAGRGQACKYHAGFAKRPLKGTPGRAQVCLTPTRGGAARRPWGAQNLAAPMSVMPQSTLTSALLPPRPCRQP